MVSNAVSMRTADVAGAVEGGMDMEGGMEIAAMDIAAMEIAAVEIAAVEINEEQAAGLETVAGMIVNALSAPYAPIVTANGVDVVEAIAAMIVIMIRTAEAA